MTITATGLGEETGVTIGGVATTVTELNPSKVRAVTGGARSRSGAVIVLEPGGNVTTPSGFTYA